jgi:zinc-binding alcohol dehydrogenase/oxidoreductase
MKAAILDSINEKLKLAEIDLPHLNLGESLVRLHAAALNHRDVWIQKGQYAGIHLPIILGSDGAGVLHKVNGELQNDLLYQKVIINPSLNWGTNPRVQAKDYVILGTPDNGTFAQYVKIPSRLVYPMPSHLSFEQAAALPLAGLTAYRAIMKRAGAQKADKVLVTGIGGGVALFCMQFAIAAGCEVFVTSGSDNKLQKAITLGAAAGVNYKQNDWDKKLKTIAGGFDVIIDSSGGDTFAKLVDLAKPAARIAMYGATRGEFKSGVAAKIFWKQLNILGSTMGNDEEFREMLAFINEHKIIPVVDEVFSLEKVNEAMQKMESSSQFGKLVLKID